jgi:hypothetical protein
MSANGMARAKSVASPSSDISHLLLSEQEGI